MTEEEVLVAAIESAYEHEFGDWDDRDESTWATGMTGGYNGQPS
jgi:hypothetical protein